MIRCIHDLPGGQCATCRGDTTDLCDFCSTPTDGHRFCSPECAGAAAGRNFNRGVPEAFGGRALTRREITTSREITK